MKKIKILFLISLLLFLAACGNKQEDTSNITKVEESNETISNSNETTLNDANEETKEEIYYLYEIAKDPKVNDITNNIPVWIDVGGGYPTLMYGDSFTEENCIKFVEEFVKLQVKKVDSVNKDNLNHTIDLLFADDSVYTFYFGDDNIAEIDGEAYEILDISPLNYFLYFE